MIGKSKQNIYKITAGGLFIALGVLIPQLFHVFGAAAGQMLLPMHLSVLIAGMTLGGGFGAAIGAITPILSMLLTAMPQMPRTAFMIVELGIYGLVGGLLYKKAKLNIYLSLILTQLAGRIAYALTLIVMGNLLGMNVPGAIAVFDATVTGLPGIALQLIIVPPLVVAIKKGGEYGERKYAQRRKNAEEQ